MEGKSGKIPEGGKNFDGIPGSGSKKYSKIPGVGESFDIIPGEERKDNNGKFQGVVKVLMKFQGDTVSENGYPQQEGTDYFWKSPFCRTFRSAHK